MQARNEDKMKIEHTGRGFAIINFVDLYGAKCSVQKSSLADKDAIWLGVDDAKPQVLATQAGRLGVETDGQRTGWVDFPIPEEVHMTTRMHLTREQVQELLPVLQRFVERGELGE